MTTYRAVVCRALGMGGGLALEQVGRTPLAAGDVRVRIEAAGLNFPDVLMAQGLYQFKPALPFIAGMEAAGRVIEVNGAGPFKVDDAVVVGAKTGAFADEIVARSEALRPMPSDMSFDEGATFSVASLTAFHGLRTRGRIARGETLLVLGAAGGVGAAAVQFGKAFGARVIAAASTAEKLAFARDCGADDVVNYREGVLETDVMRLTDGRGADLVFDPVGATPESVCRSVAFGGRILIVGFAGGTLPVYPANRLLLKGASLIGVRAGETGRADPAARIAEWAEILSVITTHGIKPKISERIPFAQFQRAYDLMAGRRALGRIVLTM